MNHFLIQLVYVLTMTVIITVYSTIFNIPMFGGKAAVIGYNVLWGLFGFGIGMLVLAHP